MAKQLSPPRPSPPRISAGAYVPTVPRRIERQRRIAAAWSVVAAGALAILIGAVFAGVAYIWVLV